MQLRGHWQCGILQAARGCFPCAEANGSSFEVNVRPGQPEEFPAPRRSVKRRQQENLIARPSGLVGLPEVIFARDIAWMLVMISAAEDFGPRRRSSARASPWRFPIPDATPPWSESTWRPGNREVWRSSRPTKGSFGSTPRPIKAWRLPGAFVWASSSTSSRPGRRARAASRSNSASSCGRR